MATIRTLFVTGVLIAVSFFGIGGAPAQNASESAGAAPPSDSELDALLQAKDWNGLSAALKPMRDAPETARELKWLHAKLDSGAGFLVAYAYMNKLWVVGTAVNMHDPVNDIRSSAGLIALYAYELIMIDGAKCEDQTAPARRLSQLLSQNGPIFSFLKNEPAALKPKIVEIAILMEKKTAPLRNDDDLLCRNGFDEMKASIEGGTQKEVPNTSGHFGKTVMVTPPPNWVPKFAPSTTYLPLQNSAREGMRERLLKVIE